MKIFKQMDFHLSYNWLKEFVAIKEPPEKMAELFQLHGASVERLRHVGDHLEKIVLGAVKKIDKHPNADRLQLVEVEVGDGRVGVVCGAQNVKVGMKVAFAFPGAKIKWHGEEEPVTLEVAKVRGCLSRGMICAAAEIGLAEEFKDEDGIMDLSAYDFPAGTPLKKVLQLDDYILDVEVTGNRPDMMSVAGLAREASAITGARLVWREPKIQNPKKPKIKLEVLNKAPDLCARYTGIVLENVKVGPSPDWLKTRLAVAGIRAINNIVDVTNYVLLELGQPLHAFDAAKLSSLKIIVRRAKKRESFLALDGRTYNLTQEMLVIADEKKPVAIAGVMGGEETGVIDSTTTVVLESATFNPVSMRRTSRALNLISDSSQLFEKGLPPHQAQVGLWRAVELLQKIAGASVASRMCDVKGKSTEQKPVIFEGERIRHLLGMEISDSVMKKSLSRLGFKPLYHNSHDRESCGTRVSVPWWRQDIKITEDLAEEVARLVGYEKFPSRLPEGELVNFSTADQKLRRRAREYLFGAGVNEIITYSFVSREALLKIGLSPDDAVKVDNPLSDEFTHLRPTVVCGAVQTIKDNEKRFASGRIFEMGRVFKPDKDGSLPEEEERLLIAFWAGADPERIFRLLKGTLEGLTRSIGITEIIFEPNAAGLFHPGRTAQVKIAGEGVGLLGQLHPRWLKANNLDVSVFVFEGNLSAILSQAKDAVYAPLPQYPLVKRDLAFVIDETIPYDSIERAIKKESGLIRAVELFDVFRGKGVPVGKRSLAVHIEYRADDMTLKDEEVEQIHFKLAEILQTKFGVEIR